MQKQINSAKRLADNDKFEFTLVPIAKKDGEYEFTLEADLQRG